MKILLGIIGFFCLLVWLNFLGNYDRKKEQEQEEIKKRLDKLEGKDDKWLDQF